MSFRCHASRVCGVTRFAISFNLPNLIFLAFRAKRARWSSVNLGSLASPLLLQDSDFLLEIIDHVLLLPVHRKVCGVTRLAISFNLPRPSSLALRARRARWSSVNLGRLPPCCSLNGYSGADLA